MLSGVTLETCWAFNKLWNNKFYYKLHLVGISTELYCNVRTVNTKVKVLHCILGITRPGQKVSGLSSEGAVRRHCGTQGKTVPLNFYLGAMRRLHDAVRRNSQEIAVYWVFESQHTLWTWPKLCSRCWPNTAFNRCVSHKTLITRLNAIFSPDSYPKNTLRGKSFKDEEQ